MELKIYTKFRWAFLTYAAAILLPVHLSVPLHTNTTDLERYNLPESHPEVIDFTYWVSIKADHWWRFAYKIVIRNNSNNEEMVQGVIRYVDAEGTTIDSTTTANISIHAGDKTTVSGHSLISASGAKRIEDAEIKISIIK